jgi:hypothetical protein
VNETFLHICQETRFCITILVNIISCIQVFSLKSTFVDFKEAEEPMQLPKFIGRNNEISLLNDLINKKNSSLVVIKGRRRIGKSRLIEEFAKNMKFYQFSGLALAPGITS